MCFLLESCQFHIILLLILLLIIIIIDRKQLTMPSLRMYEDQCKADREGVDSDASSSEAPAGRDQVHSPLGGWSSPLRFSRPNRGECCWDDAAKTVTSQLRLCAGAK